MNAVVKIESQDLNIVEYQGKRVVTFAMIDEVHQRPEGTARKRFNDNKHHLVEGEDFYFIDSSLKSEFRTFGIQVPNRGLIVLTESGYLMLTKSFTDDLAWQVQRQLVNGYFNAKDLVANIAKKEMQFNLGSVARQCVTMAKAFGLKGNQIYLSADRAVKQITGESPLELLGTTHLHAPVQEQVFTPTQIGEMFTPKLSGQKINKVLADLGYQTKEGDVWLLTEKGQAFGELFDTGKKHSDGVPVKQLKWNQSVIQFVKGAIA
ncbi:MULTISPECIES: ORF6N domain-containing protein [Acinetobacter]|uniref:KilA-N DNA-binding domain-containing protein n=1 Tax=Acinetobacter higginsii TaxID=70347 RepID=N9RJJ1_9GAMM|nr:MULTISPECIES: ORF6N domain-containing protein [Acinetobacter]ENX58143.1 hypothetical protein F902_02543 [Acinetobacter higginsii]